MTATEHVRYGYVIRGLLYDVQEPFLLYQEGRLEPDYWATRAAILDAYLVGPAARSVYERDKAIGALHVDFVAWLDARLDPS